MTATIKTAVYVHRLLAKMNDQVYIGKLLSHVIRRRDSSDDESKEPFDDEDDEEFISFPEQAYVSVGRRVQQILPLARPVRKPRSLSPPPQSLSQLSQPIPSPTTPEMMRRTLKVPHTLILVYSLNRGGEHAITPKICSSGPAFEDN